MFNGKETETEMETEKRKQADDEASQVRKRKRRWEMITLAMAKWSWKRRRLRSSSLSSAAYTRQSSTSRMLTAMAMNWRTEDTDWGRCLRATRRRMTLKWSPKGMKVWRRRIWALIWMRTRIRNVIRVLRWKIICNFFINVVHILYISVRKCAIWSACFFF